MKRNRSEKMRLRKRPGAEEMLDEYTQFVVEEPKQWRGNWSGKFDNDHPIHVEIGTGKGRFTIEMAKRYPELNFIGIELQESVLLCLLEKQIEENLPNLQLVQFNALEINQLFEKGEVEKIYLNFSDPWPKNRHEKRRLTFPDFLVQYQSILKGSGTLQLKTDNRGLFEYSLCSFSQSHWILEEVLLDLHVEEPEENIRTEFEEKYSKKGHPIYLGVFTPAK